jgi:hypothetical protein
MTRRRIAAVVTLASLIAACGGSSQNESNLGTDPASGLERSNRPRLYGTVSDSNARPIAGALVSDGSGRSTTTASDGTYSLAEQAGTYTFTVSRTGYVTFRKVVDVFAAVRVDFQLQSAASTPPPTSGGGSYKVFANNDLGMHCVDASFAVFSILPPYNVVDAQVVQLQSSGDPVLLDATAVDVRYSAVADATGSINSTAKGKSNFYAYAQALYGAALSVGQGLQGMWMPADAPTAAGTTLEWDAAMGLFKAPGIPIFPTDDAGKPNPYPLMRFSALDKSGNALGSTDVVLPVSDETSCSACHATGTGQTEDQVRQNILDLHNAKLGTNLVAPVLCASCHYSPALDLAGSGPSQIQSQHLTMSRVMHDFHASRVGAYTDAAVGSGAGFVSAPPMPTQQACYTCHPGARTQCLRGAMTSALDCQNCHGRMSAVGGAVSNRTPWLDEPKCQSCHAGDAVGKTASDQPYAADGIRFTLAYSPADATATPKLATNKRFAENDLVDSTGKVVGAKLYRKSKGHGGLACEACHGSTHAIWSAGPNDDVAATQLQGHAGTVVECSACHLAAPPNGLGGPHGMHPVGGAWVSGHENVAQGNQASCQPCHGTDYRGTVLSRTSVARTLAGKAFAAGAQIGCYDCHAGPNPG